MTRVLRHVTLHGFVYYIDGNDHLPMHVHVFCGSASGDEAIINLEALDFRVCYMKRKDAQRALSLVAKHQNELLREWKRLTPSLNNF